jgi:hypothetical protein
MVHGEAIWNTCGYLEYYLTNNHLPTERKSRWLPLSSRNVLFWYKQKKKEKYTHLNSKSLFVIYLYCIWSLWFLFIFDIRILITLCYLQHFLIDEGSITDGRLFMVVWSLSYNIYLNRLHCWYIGVDKEINRVHNLFYWAI